MGTSSAEGEVTDFLRETDEAEPTKKARLGVTKKNPCQNEKNFSYHSSNSEGQFEVAASLFVRELYIKSNTKEVLIKKFDHATDGLRNLHGRV